MMSSFWIVIACIGLAIITLVTRAFFMIPEQEVPLPNWLKRGLKYAPLAALAAVIAPEIVMSNGQLISSFADARLPALAAAVVYFFYKRSILGTIALGMVIYLPLHIGWGW
ncbi:AzlD domain-containing protein [Comamonas suwonensis]|mgnify:FL=1|uniref:AzlD domain-containing protein n=1 Tax=Comamonas suwonensis TaxID=2606214 RepID=UPI00145E86AD|nr:AzlD domain-containing protein [Comamonas suwonensis]MBI1623034.1 AzlD domain-containing protein [Comamonas suwonensis]